MKTIWAFGLISSMWIAVFAYMIADTQPPYDYIAEKSYVIPNPANPGHQVMVHWEFKVNRLCPGSIVRTIVDAKTGAKVSYDPTPALLTVRMGDTSLQRTFFLPEGMMAGRKIYRANAEYICNPLQRFFPLKVQTPDIFFDVALDREQKRE